MLVSTCALEKTCHDVTSYHQGHEWGFASYPSNPYLFLLCCLAGAYVHGALFSLLDVSRRFSVPVVQA